MQCIAVLSVTAGVVLAGCGGEAGNGMTDGTEGRPSASRTGPGPLPSAPGSFAYREMAKQSRKTCWIVPREILARSFARAGDPDLGGTHDPAGWSDHYVALSYAQDVEIDPIRLQQAAYDGCLAGLKARR